MLQDGSRSLSVVVLKPHRQSSRSSSEGGNTQHESKSDLDFEALKCWPVPAAGYQTIKSKGLIR